VQICLLQGPAEVTRRLNSQQAASSPPTCAVLSAKAHAPDTVLEGLPQRRSKHAAAPINRTAGVSQRTESKTDDEVNCACTRSDQNKTARWGPKRRAGVDTDDDDFQKSEEVPAGEKLRRVSLSRRDGQARDLEEQRRWQRRQDEKERQLQRQQQKQQAKERAAQFEIERDKKALEEQRRSR
jgi:hypothetical protein